MRLLTSTDYKIMPWKNGLGQTTELVKSPHSVDADIPVQWRLSIADVPGSGPFSIFPNTDRIIIQLDGPPMTLSHADASPAKILKKGEPYAFSGEWITQCEVASPARDFNIMVDRRFFSASADVTALLPEQETRIPLRGTVVIIHLLEGSARISDRSHNASLDLCGPTTMIWDSPETPSHVTVKSGAKSVSLVVISLEKTG